jgi:hypothetical protein
MCPRLKELERENQRLKAIMADQALENRALKVVIEQCVRGVRARDSDGFVLKAHPGESQGRPWKLSSSKPIPAG